MFEHSANPEIFIRELQRVAKAGYIETPDAFMERINPYWDHRSEVTVRNGVLLVRKMAAWQLDSELVELYEERAKSLITSSVIPSNPFTFHTRFYWTDHIPFRIINPEVNASWEPPTVTQTTQIQMSLRAKIGRIGLAMARKFFSQRQRNRKIQLEKLLQCPSCKSTKLKFSESILECIKCSRKYDVINGVPRMPIEK